MLGSEQLSPDEAVTLPGKLPKDSSNDSELKEQRMKTKLNTIMEEQESKVKSEKTNAGCASCAPCSIF